MFGGPTSLQGALSSLLAPIPSRWGLFFSWAVVGGCNPRQGRSVLQSTPVAYLPHRGTSEHLSNQLLTPPGLFPQIPHAQFPRRTLLGSSLNKRADTIRPGTPRDARGEETR